MEAAAGSVEWALVESVKASVVLYAVDINGELACLFGCAPINGMLGLRAAPWLLGTDVLDRHPSALMRHTAPYLAQMQRRYPHLLNYVDARNTRSIRWLKRLGFVIHPARPFGVAQLPFHYFEMRV